MKFCIAPAFGTLSIKGIGLLGTIACIPYPFGMFESMIFPTSPFGGICDRSLESIQQVVFLGVLVKHVFYI